MEGFVIRAVVVGIGLWLASKIVSGIGFDSTGTLIAAALLLGIVNAFVRPIIVILTLPITLLTLGIFLLVINALMIELVAYFLPGFVVAGFWPAILPRSSSASRAGSCPAGSARAAASKS